MARRRTDAAARRKAAARCSMAVLAAAAAAAVHAQAWPARPLRLIVPFPPGGSTDLYARTLDARLGDALGQQVVVDNRPGAGGALGAELAARAPTDGHTIWIGQTANLAIGPALRRRPAYDAVRDFAAITLVQKASSVFVVSAASPLRSLKDVIAEARRSPQGLTYGSAGIGTAGHINGHLLGRAAGVDLVHVPYKGASPAMVDLQGGRIALMATSIGSSAGLIRQGRVRAIGTTGATRARLLPEVPTLAEQGLAGFDVTTWHAMLAPALTPAAIVGRLNEALVRILGLREVQDALSAEGGEVSPTTPAEAARFIREDAAKWARVLKDANITVE